MGLVVAPAGTDERLDACLAIWNAITPDQPAVPELVRARNAREPRRLYLLAERNGIAVGCGFAGPSQTEGRGFVSPRVLPGARRRGVGRALLGELCAHLTSAGFTTASAHADGNDPAAVAFAARFGFVTVDRQVEQIRVLGDERRASMPPEIAVVSIAEQPSLLRELYPLAQQGYADMATVDAVGISLEEWLEEEATIPEASLVALVHGDPIAFSGLSGTLDAATDGLTVVRSDWRRRGVAASLKRDKLARAAALGVREITTWTQERNAAMRAVNESLGYAYRDVTLDVRAPLPLDAR
jgi:GNAT superfamily N-acetyltransferase